MNENTLKLPVPENESSRLKALKEYNILDTLPEEQFDRLTKLASIICETPIALISLIDDERQWFKSRIGLDVEQTSRDVSFCQYTIMGKDFFEVEDALEDNRFKKNPLVLENPNIRFYAAYPLIDPEGYALGSLCMIDQSPKKLSEQQKAALKTLSEDIMLQIVGNKKNEERRKLEKFFMMSMDMICIAGIEGYFTKVNPAFTKTLGWTEQELLQRPFIEFVHPDDVNKTIMEIQKLSNGISTVDFINRFKTNKNTYCLLQWAANPDTLKGELFAVARDITEQNDIKENLQKAKTEADRARSMQEQFLANMSHEIRTPMNAILGFTSFLKVTELNEKQTEFISNISIASENLLGIINDILDVSKIEAGMVQIENTTFNLRTHLMNLHALMMGKAGEKNLDLSLHIDEGLPEFVVSDPTRLSQILINLISNAVKFTNNGFVNIRTELERNETETSWVKFIIQDSGIGIAKENRDMIFDRFKQESSDTTRKYGGTGLGLSIVKNLTELMGGQISIESVIGRGSDFIVLLPLIKCNDQQLNEYLEIQDKKKYYDNSIPVKLNILLAEDNRINQQYCKMLLNQFGFECTIANNGKEALKCLEKQHFDLILMDIQMPEMDGYEATRIIRSKLMNSIPIIALTANAMADEHKKCFEMGMDSYVSKPFQPADLHLKIMDIYANKLAHPTFTTSIVNLENIAKKKPLIEPEFIKSQVQGNLTAANELLEIFIQDVPDEMKKLKSAVEIYNYEAINEVSHKLVSSFSILGIASAVHILQSMEQLGSKKTDPYIIVELYNKLLPIYNESLMQVQEINLEK